MQHIEFYKRIGIRRISQLLHPIVLKVEDFSLPRNSCMLHYNNSKLPYLPNSKEGVTINLELRVYAEGEIRNPKGDFTLKSDKLKKFVRIAKRYDRESYYTYKKKEVMNRPASELVVLSTGGITANYSYRNTPNRDYSMWRNELSTAIGLVTGFNSMTNRKVYMTFDTTASRPTYKLLKTYVDSVNEKKIVEHFPNFTSMTILEIFKFISGKKSMFDMEDSERENINLVMTNGDKVVMINLNLLYSFSSASEIETKTGKVKPEKLIKALLLLFSRMDTIQTTPAKTIDRFMKEEGDEVDRLPTDEELDALMEEEIDDTSYNDEEEEELRPAFIEPITDEVIMVSGENLEEEAVEYVEKLASSDEITPKQLEKHKEVLEKQSHLIEMAKVDLEELVVTEEMYSLPDIDVVLDKSYLDDTNGARDRLYINKVYKKDLTNAFLSLNKIGFAVTDFEIDEVEKVGGGVTTLTVKLKHVKGDTSTVIIKLPTINEDGTYRIADNTYRLRKQKVDKPIRKKSPTIVLLSSFYGKLFINKAKYSKSNLSSYINKHLVKQTETGLISNIVSLPNVAIATKLPLEYSIISRKTRSFRVKHYDLTFSYSDRNIVVNYDESLLKKLEGNKYVLVGKSTLDDTYILMDKDGNLVENYKNNISELEHVYDILDLDMNKAPIEYSAVKIYSKVMPIGFILMYYIGITNMINMFTKAKRLPVNKKVIKSPDYYYIYLADTILELPRKDKLGTIIIAGLNEYKDVLKLFEYNELDDTNTFPAIFQKLNIPINYMDELDLVDKMFVDPVTETILRQMDEPTNLKGLLIRSSELLLTDYAEHPNNMDEMLIRGYDRIVGMMYSELIAGARAHRDKTRFGGSAKIGNEIPYFGTWNLLGSDSGSVIVDDINPIAALKQTESVSRTGMFGMVKEAITAPTREFHSSEVGVTGGATPASGEAGATMYLSANPNIHDVRGAKSVDASIGKGNAFATSFLLLPATLNDDGKRANFVQVQLGHLIPMDNAVCNPVRTGYETVLAYRVTDKYAVVARERCEVIKVTRNKIVVRNTDNLAEKSYKLGAWHTKDISGVSFTQRIITDFKVGETIEVGEGICYNTNYFEPDLLYPKRLVFKSGIIARVSFTESKEVYEDSCSMSERMSYLTGSTTTSVVSIWLKSTDAILDVVNIGDDIKPGQVLAAILSDLGDTDSLSKETLDLLKAANRKTPKSKYTGKVIDIRSYYNADLNKISTTTKDIVLECDKRLANERGDKTITGKVGREFSSGGKKLVDGDVLLQIYIEVPNTMEVADKLVLSGQLKATVGHIFSEKITNERGDVIDLQFSYKSVGNRIVYAVTKNGSTLELAQHYTKTALEIYNS